MSIEADSSSPLSDEQTATLDCTISMSNSTDTSGNKNDESTPDEEGYNEKSEPKTTQPMAFTIDFGQGKSFDNRRLEELAKKSQARHQRVQSMSVTSTRLSAVVQKPPMSVKLSRKTQGYNSEGYFSSDQEDSILSNCVKSNSIEKNTTCITSPVSVRNIDISGNLPSKKSKSPMVDSIMSRSDTFQNRKGLKLPLRPNNSYNNVNKISNFSNVASSCQLQHTMEKIIDQSPEDILLIDISSPELDALTPDNGLSTPEPNCPTRKNIAISEAPDLLFKGCPMKVEPLYIDDDIDRQSNSSTGTYIIEKDTYSEEQKARMSIDRTLANKVSDNMDSIASREERNSELIFEFSDCNKVITKEPRRDCGLRTPLTSKKTLATPNKVSKEKNVLEISCCYESPTETDLAVQTTKQIKSTRSYLEKIKNRVKTITEKTFSKSPPKHCDAPDVGSVTSVTTSGILSFKNPLKIETSFRRRCSLTKSEIDQTDYVHRLSRESSVPVVLPSSTLVFEDSKFESSVMKNAERILREDVMNADSDEVVRKLSHLSLNRCKGDKTWIQDWAESVKKYNNDTLAVKEINTNYLDRPPLSPRHIPCNIRSPHDSSSPSKIPSPVGTLLHRKTPDLIPTQETESYLLRTQNAITNLQAKLHSSRTNNFSNIPSQLTSSLISERTAVSRLPVSQLSRSNSLNYRLRRRDNSGESSPLRSPEHYVVTGSSNKSVNTKLIKNTSRSLETDERCDSNMNSPERVFSTSSDDKTLSNRPKYDVEAILSPHRKIYTNHKSYDNRQEFFKNDSNQNVNLKTVLKNNAFDSPYRTDYIIEQTRRQGDEMRSHQRMYSDGLNKPQCNNKTFGPSIRRSSSFNTVNKNNNYIDYRLSSRRSSDQSVDGKCDYQSDDSDNLPYDKSQEARVKKQANRSRGDAPDVKLSIAINASRCPNTPEMQRKFGPGFVRNSVRGTTREYGLNTRMSEPPIGREERLKSASHQSRKVNDSTRQAVLNRLTKSRSSTRENPKSQDKGHKKPTQHRSSTALASKELEFTNWKKRSSYDPMKAAQEGKKRQQMTKRQEINKDDLSSPSHSSPVHRSQSFHVSNIADLETLDYYSSEDEQVMTLPVDPMITSTHSDILDLRKVTRRQPVASDVVISRDYVPNFQINKKVQKPNRRSEADKRKTYIVEDLTPIKNNVNFMSKSKENDSAVDKRKTFILDSDTNSTTNGSSPRNSSIFSHEKNSLTTCTSDTEGESGTESAPVVMRHQGAKRTPAQAKHRYSGDYSMSSSTTSITQKKPKEIQPRYLDISKYKNESSAKNFLRRDPSKTYVGVLNHGERAGSVSKGSAQHYEMEQKKQELEKWKRRASYDPRKAAALGKTNKAQAKTTSVLRSQSFHGPMLVSTSRYQAPPSEPHLVECYDQSSDNDF